MLMQFLVSYLLVFLLPVASILLYYYPNSTQAAKEKEMAWNSHMTEQFMNAMDIFTRYVYDLPYELMRNRDLKMYLAPHDDYHRYILANEMRKYNATDGFVYNTLLYVKEVDYLFSKTGNVYTVDDFNRRGVGYYYEAWPHGRMFEELERLDAPLVRGVEAVVVPGNNRARMMTFLLPMPSGEQSPGVLLIQVLESTIARLAHTMSDSYNGTIFILDERGQPLVSTQSVDYEASPAFEQLVAGLAEQPPGAAIHRVEGKEYIVSRTVSDRNGWQYVSLLPLTESLQTIRSIQWNSVLIFLFILLVEIVVIYISLRYNYHPIKRLVQAATEVFQHRGLPAMSEVETIRYTLDQLSSDNSRLDEEVRRHQPIVRDALLFDLASGRFESWEAYSRQGGAHAIAIAGSRVTAAILSFAGYRGEEETLRQAMQQEEARLAQAAEEGACYLFPSVYPQEYILLVTHEPEAALDDQLAAMQTRLETAVGVAPAIGIGQAESAETPAGAHHSYLQALRAAEQLRLCRQSTLLRFAELAEPNSGSVAYSAELLQSLEMAILKNEAGMVQTVLERLLDHMRGEGMPSYRIRSVYANTVSILISGLQRFRRDDVRLLRLTDAVLLHSYTLEQMADIMRDTADKLCDLMQAAKPEARAASPEEILSMLESQAFEADFSLQTMADHFGMSLSGFSYHFKKTIGHNFKESVERLRITKSMQLLRESDAPLASIAEQVGYTNTSSFIRAFKKIAGATPGHYRETQK